MQNALKLVPSYWDVTRHQEQISVTRELLNEYKEKDPTIKTIPGQEYIMNEYNSIFSLILLQAISKKAELPIQMITNDFDARPNADAIIEEQRYFQNGMDNFPDSYKKTLIVFSRIAKSTFSSAAYTAIRKECGKAEKAFDDMFSRLTGNVILGATKYTDKPWVVLHIHRNTNLKTIGQIFSLLIAQTMLDLNIENYPEKEKELFTKLRAELYTAPENSTFENMPPEFQGKLQNIIIDYTAGLPEYTIDQEYQLQCLVRNLKKNQYRDLEIRVNSTKDKLESALERFRDANENYQNALRKFTAAKYFADNDTSLNDSVKELLHIMRNYKCIRFFQVDTGKGIQYKVVQNLHINSKEDWTKIEKHAVPDEILRRLLHETLIDEKYNLITEAGMQINLTNYTICRYNIMDREHGLPHPHIMRYNCFGTYQTLINEELLEANFLGAVEESIEAASGLNWADAPVISGMIDELNAGSFYKKIFVNKETGECFSYADYREANSNETNE